MLVRSILILIAISAAAVARAQQDIFADTDDAAEQQGDADLSVKLLIPAALATGELTTFVAIMKSAALTDELDSRRPLTVFAPTDQAFHQLPEGTITRLLKPDNRDQLVALVKNHILRSTFPEEKLRRIKKLKTMNDESWTPEVTENEIVINDAKIRKSDIPFRKGVLHIVDKVMTPKQ